jgi:hypothetical protein
VVELFCVLTKSTVHRHANTSRLEELDGPRGPGPGFSVSSARLSNTWRRIADQRDSARNSSNVE